jgi:hypothetical protein
MNLQTSINYYSMFAELVTRHTQLVQQRNEIDSEVTKLKQLILATLPLLPEDKQSLFQAEIEKMEEQSGGLLSAIRLVFSAHKGEWLTPTEVRDHLTAMGFNLTQYRANPLASIGTTLRRMVPSQLDSKTSPDGQVLYQRRLTLLDQMGRAHLEKLKWQRDKLLHEGEQILRNAPKGNSKRSE